MRNIKIKLVKAHLCQYKDLEIQRELDSVQCAINEMKFSLDQEAVYMVFIKGIYDDFNKKMTTALVFINNTGKSITELSGVVRIRAKEPKINIAKARINFDEQFLGEIDDKEGILIHLNIPVKGLNKNREFEANEMMGEFSDVKITYKFD